MITTRALALIGLCVVPSLLNAQSLQRVSMQASFLGAQLFGDAYLGFATGFGAEVQVRYNHSALSFGAGLQRTDHALAGFTSKVRVAGLFFEPRYVLPKSITPVIAPYASARASLLQQHLSESGRSSSTTGLTINVGGGVLIRLAGRVNGEVGATYGYTRFGDYTLRLPNGQSQTGPSGSGSNIVFRTGLAVGVSR